MESSTHMIVKAVIVSIAALVTYRAQAIDPHFCAISNLDSSEKKESPVAKLLSKKGPFEQWIIPFPEVKMKAFSYEQLQLNAGDKFRVSACGCVQTGGVGKTWKRYVDPSGPNSKSLYHGFVSVDLPVSVSPVHQAKLSDGAELNYVRVEDLMSAEASNSNFWLQARAREALTLGYEDDHYGDNGYWKHDNGTENQCENVGGAVVEVEVLRGS